MANNMIFLPLFYIITTFILFLLGHGLAQPPALDYKPSTKFTPLAFNDVCTNLWGPSHQTVNPNSGVVTLRLDNSSGSGFISKNSYKYGYFEVSMKLPNNTYSAGLNANLYLSNGDKYKGHHDEVDIEFLGPAPGKPYTLQTNVYVNGSGDGFFNHNIPVIGREMQFHLWFDPTKDFHRYAIIWNPTEIIFFVDDYPIRQYPNKNGNAPLPKREMWLYGTIWDASDWATENGKYKVDYKYAPFVIDYTNFKVGPATSVAAVLTKKQLNAMAWVQKYYMAYNYCTNKAVDYSQTPECR